MKIVRRIFIIALLSAIALLLIMALYLNYGYQIYFKFGSLKIGNSNNFVIYIIVGIILFIIGTYFLIRQILTRKGIILTIILYFMIFMLPFFFLIVEGMNKNYSFTYKTESKKKLLIMGYGNKKKDDMKYIIYENLFWGFYDKIGEIDLVNYRLSNDNIILKKDIVGTESLYYIEENKMLILTYINSNNEIITTELPYKH